MYIEYEPSLVNKIRDISDEAGRTGKTIRFIKLNTSEWAQLLGELSVDGLNCYRGKPVRRPLPGESMPQLFGVRLK